MKVLKFGGTSLGTPQRMLAVAGIIQQQESAVVVLSAVGGTTDALQRIISRRRNQEPVSGEIEALLDHYQQYINGLFQCAGQREKALIFVDQMLGSLEAEMILPLTDAGAKNILAKGEVMSTRLFGWVLEEQGLLYNPLNAFHFMRLDENNEPDQPFLRERLLPLIEEAGQIPYFVTQGYICRNAGGGIDNLRRGGSDYTATLIGAALQADEIQIWTDIDGIHNNDPRIVDNTRPVRQLSYREAAELAYFGAKILHPTCVIPAEQQGIPLRLKNTFEPLAEGTLISLRSSGQRATAVAVKHGITAIRMESDRMLNAYGFLRKVFEVFEQHRTPIDMITTSEVSVSLTIDQLEHVPQILNELQAFGTVTVDNEQSIICIVGDQIGKNTRTLLQVVQALKDIPLRMVSHGGSSNNISLLIPEPFHIQALRALHEVLFMEYSSIENPMLNEFGMAVR